MALWLRKHQDMFLFPALVLVIYILVFGLQASQQGYYLDDWIILNSYSRGGATGLFYYAFWGNRPLVFWLWLIGFKLLHFTPLLWQIWAGMWRWLTVVMVWLVLRRLWPKAVVQVSLAALLFSVYPLFRQQASALTYSFHWICFFLWGLSVYSMARAVQQPKWFVPWMGLSVIAGAAQLFSQEFFVGLELLRPVVLWLALTAIDVKGRERVRRTALAWAPFLLLFVGFLVWRVRLMPTPGVDRNTPGMLLGLLTAPLSTLPKLVVMVLQDLIQMMLGTWYETIQPSLVALTPVSSLLAWGVAGLVFLLALGMFWWAYRRTYRENLYAVPPNGAPTVGGTAAGAAWYSTAIPFGVIAMLLGFAPGWTIGGHIYDLTGIYNDRFGLAAMFGAALILVGLVEWLVRAQTYRLVLVCVLIGLGAGQNYRYETNYRWSWEKQAQMFWQMKWRAPDLQRPTTVYGQGSIISYLGSWATTSAVSQLYGPARDPWYYDFWYRDVTKINVDTDLQNKDPMQFGVDSIRYAAPADSGLVIDFEPDKLQCLWVLGPQDKTNPYLSDKLAQARALSNLNQVLPDAGLSPDPAIFGREPAHDWCYFYEKADLARQQQDWGKVVSLWQQAAKQGKHPHVGVEYGAFIEGFAHTGDWSTALDLTRKAAFPKYVMRSYVCSTWARINASTTVTPQKQQAILTAINNFDCQDEIKK